MPDGHQEDTRPLWQRFKDMETEYEKSLDLNFKLRQKVQYLEVDKEALLVSLKAIRFVYDDIMKDFSEEGK